MSLENFLYQKLESGLGFSPTICQQRLFRSLSAFLHSEEHEIFLIEGYAGTGKTSAVASLVAALNEFEISYVLLAPTGRAAKVLSGYTGVKAYTIHKHIYRQKTTKEGPGAFSLRQNLNHDTVYIVDEASLISNGSRESSIFGSGRLLDDLMEFIKSKRNNKLILLGDPAQLPPVGLPKSDALDINVLNLYGNVANASLTTVVRQAEGSGILYNATLIREQISASDSSFPGLEIPPFTDVERIGGGELIEKISEAFDKYGVDETLVLCRSNKRANRYNDGIRGKILFREEQLSRGDKLMVVKNCYQFLEEIEELDFIANGDVAELMKISKYEERYGLKFAEAILKFPDYNNVEIKAKIILDTLTGESPSLGMEEQRRLFNEVMEDYAHIKGRRKRIMAVREDVYFNALQIKFASAVTCHKSQGGQWRCVFIDNPFWGEELSVEDLRWLYTAVTRATDMLYFVNFDKKFFKRIDKNEED
jgi:exodeoxyribonuclease-5